VAGPWVLDTRDLGRRPGASKHYQRTAPASETFGFEPVVMVPAGTEITFDVLLESVVEGVLVSGSASVATAGECSRCLDPITGSVEVEFSELYAYPDSVTEETTDSDEVFRLVDDLIDLEPVVRDAIVFELPQAPLCSPDCLGLCPGCGGRRAELGPNHEHETIDARWAALQDRFGGDQES